MREVLAVLALTGRHLCEALRARDVRVLGVVGALLLAAAVLLPARDPQATAAPLLGGLLVTGLLAFLAAAYGGSLLPADRAEGRAAWLATLRPSGVARRLAPAAAGMGLALLAALAASLVVAALVSASGSGTQVSRVRALPGAEGTRLRAPVHGGEPLVLAVPPVAGKDAEALEVEFSPRFLRLEATRQPIDVTWQGGTRGGTQRLTYQRRLRLDLPAGADRIELRNLNEGADLVVRAAWAVGPRASLLPSLLLAGLALGLAAAATAPVAVALSRRTSGPTAMGAALVLVLLGGLRFVLEGLPPAPATRLQEIALALLDGVSRIAPDLAALGSLSAPAWGRALEPAALLSLGSFLLYGAVALALVLCPWPGGERREVWS